MLLNIISLALLKEPTISLDIKRPGYQSAHVYHHIDLDLLMNPARECFAMGLIGGRGKASVIHVLVAWLVITVVMFQSAVALMETINCQGPVIFQYNGTAEWGNLTFQVPPNAVNGEITHIKSDSITYLGDFQADGTMSLIQNEISRDVSGRWLYNQSVELIRQCTCNSVTSFSTMFEISITAQTEFEWFTGSDTSLEGLAFIIVPTDAVSDLGSAGGYLGFMNPTTTADSAKPNHFAVEFDYLTSVEFQDPDYVHVGVNLNSMTSMNTSVADWSKGFVPHGEATIIIWIEYDGSTKMLRVYGAWSGSECQPSDVFSGPTCKPTTPIVSKFVDLTSIISSNSMYVGFSGSISYNSSYDSGNTYGYKINGWTFNSDGPAPDLPRPMDGSIGDASKGNGNLVTLVITIPSIFVLLILLFTIYLLYRRNGRLTALAKKYEIEIGVLDRGPQAFKYKALSTATKGFSPNELLGSGGFGSVYKGRLVLNGDEKQTNIAVKRISATSNQGAREFLAEVKIIGQVQHRNLVRLLGWCHEKGELLLVYDYMPNGSVDQHLFKTTAQETILTWARRLKIVSGVATALAYLHEEWEQRVIHRDVKSSNVMLDRDFNARLGDFGLARLSAHDQAPQSTAVLAGTYGYLAPELAHSLKATEKTDVYSFGAVVLEVATGKRPILSLEDQKIYSTILLVDWVWSLYKDNALLNAADPRLRKAYDPGEMIMFLKIGLLCSHPDPDVRPTMREVLNIWKGASPFPSLPQTKPVPIFISCVDGYGPDKTFTISTNPTDISDGSWDTNSTMHSDGQSTSSESVRNPSLRYRRSNTTTALPL